MALITFSPKYKGHRAMVVPADKAKEINLLWRDPPGDLSEEQYDMLACIEKIYFNTRADKVTPVDTSHLYHEGVQQSSYDAIPTGDR